MFFIFIIPLLYLEKDKVQFSWQSYSLNPGICHRRFHFQSQLLLPLLKKCILASLPNFLLKNGRLSLISEAESHCSEPWWDVAYPLIKVLLTVKETKEIIAILIREISIRGIKL